MSAAELPVPYDEPEVPEGMKLDKDGRLRPVGSMFTAGNDHAGNGGRKKGLARMVREMVADDPTRICDVLFDILEDPQAKNADRIAAGKELLDRGWGKAPTFTPIEGGDPLERSELDQAIREIAEKLVEYRAHHAVIEHPTT